MNPRAPRGCRNCLDNLRVAVARVSSTVQSSPRRDGARKGFNADAFEILSKIPEVEGIWQLHRAVQSDSAHNTLESMIANLDEGEADQALGIKVSMTKDGSFTVTNSRNNFSKTYKAR
jgi:hypothetical protein